MSEYIDSSSEFRKQDEYLFPIPVTKVILKANKNLAFDKDMPPEKLDREFPFWIDKSPVSHNKEMNTLDAVDFLVPVGTNILAVKDGIVSAIEEDSFEYGWIKDFSDKANYICISHDDDIISEYIHLGMSSVSRVGLKVGDTVMKGQKIGETGLSGWMDIPHLHFALYKNIGGGTVRNIKVNFQRKLWRILRYK